MALSDMYAQQAARAAHNRRMAELQHDEVTATMYQGAYDEAIARSLDAKFSEDREYNSMFCSVTDPNTMWANAKWHEWERQHPAFCKICYGIGTIVGILVSVFVVF